MRMAYGFRFIFYFLPNKGQETSLFCVYNFYTKRYLKKKKKKKRLVEGRWAAKAVSSCFVFFLARVEPKNELVLCERKDFLGL